ncbi:transporter substrate-binding domain-containing protein [Bacteroidota bacterium]
MKSFFSFMHLYFTLILIFSFTILFTSCCDNNSTSPDNSQLNDQIENITYYTEHYPPFNYEQGGTLYGLSVDILNELFAKMGVNLDRSDVNLGEWGTIYQTTLETNNTMLFSTVRSTERENLFKWVGPIAPHKEVLVSLSNNNVEINNSSELPNYTIGSITNYSAVQILINYGVNASDIILVENPDDLYAMLLDGTVDCITYTETGHQLVLNALSLNESDFEIPFVLMVNELYYAFNINTNEDVVDYFQSTLDDLKNDKAADGTSIYDRIISSYDIINYSDEEITDEQVINLVNLTSDDMVADAPGTITKINNSEAPYKDVNIPSLYSFVYDTTLTVVAHATNNLIVGANFKGKPDVSGKLFRDEILAGALANGTGWVDYIYTKPGVSGLYYKTTYYKLTTGSNGKLYIVCAGKYK